MDVAVPVSKLNAQHFDNQADTQSALATALKAQGVALAERDVQIVLS